MSAASSISPTRDCGPHLGRAPSLRSTRFDRATPSVAAMVFTGKRLAPASATARSVFWPPPGRRLLEDLDLQGLAVQEPLDLPHAFLEAPNLGCRDHIIVDPDSLLSPFAHRRAFPASLISSITESRLVNTYLIVSAVYTSARPPGRHYASLGDALLAPALERARGLVKSVKKSGDPAGSYCRDQRNSSRGRIRLAGSTIDPRSPQYLSEHLGKRERIVRSTGCWQPRSGPNCVAAHSNLASASTTSPTALYHLLSTAIPCESGRDIASLKRPQHLPLAPGATSGSRPLSSCEPKKSKHDGGAYGAPEQEVICAFHLGPLNPKSHSGTSTAPCPTANV
jgi:hypothetical protein